MRCLTEAGTACLYLRADINMTMLVEGLVSIVTPAYKAGRFVEACIQSVQAQTHGMWELLIADDCSPDDTGDRVLRYARSDKRVKYLRLNSNGGAATARNAALARSRGQFVAFLDSDDLWLPAKLERQLNFMEREELGLSFTAFRRISEDGQNIGRLISVPPRISYSELLGDTAIATSTVIVDRFKSGPITMRKAYYDDFVLWLELLKRHVVAGGLPEDLMRYRVVGGSISRNKWRSAKEVWKTYRNIENLDALTSAWHLAGYSARGWLKYRRF
jgi:teichuronic acid biosynthesis glycosyltransferase TuaG